jgi:hypothetical protein
VPTTTSRNAQATLSVRDGDTIILGGYIEETRNSGKSGVPILKDIPGLGALFRSKTDRTTAARSSSSSCTSRSSRTRRRRHARPTPKRPSLPGISAAEEEFRSTHKH